MKDFFEVEPNPDLININLGVASYNVQIGSKLISTLVAELLIDKNQSVVIIDEAHERSIQTDQLLLLLKKAMTKRKDLKVVIMSATINLSLFRNYFPPPLTFGEVDAGEHTTYEIEDHYLEKTPPPNEWKNLAIKQILKILQSTEEGDILVFVRSGGDGATLCQTLNSEANKLRKDKGNI